MLFSLYILVLVASGVPEMAPSAERRKTVQTLRQLARDFGVHQVLGASSPIRGRARPCWGRSYTGFTCPVWTPSCALPATGFAA